MGAKVYGVRFECPGKSPSEPLHGAEVRLQNSPGHALRSVYGLGPPSPSPWRLEEPTGKSRSDGSAAKVQLANGTTGHEPRPPARVAIQTSATLPALAPAPAVPSQESTRERRPRAMDPPTVAPACAAAQRRNLGV